MKTQIIQAIKNFDINKLNTLLDDERSYMDVSKSLFLKTLEKKFESAQKNGCNSFDDVFFGICESCNKGCEGMTFYSNSGYYLDIYMEDENETVNDIYVCNKLLNFTNLKKTHDLGFNFKLDQEVRFSPDNDYIIIRNQYKSLINDLDSLNPNIKLNAFVDWFKGYSYMRNFIANTSFFVVLRYELYYKIFNLISDIDKILKVSIKAKHAIEALIDFQIATSEREKLIWFYENEADHKATKYLLIPENLSIDPVVSVKCYSHNLDITVNISGYEYVIDYFRALDNFHDEMIEKYFPSQEYFLEAGEEGLVYSIEKYLTIHKVHLDVLKRYGKKTDF